MCNNRYNMELHCILWIDAINRTHVHLIYACPITRPWCFNPYSDAQYLLIGDKSLSLPETLNLELLSFHSPVNVSDVVCGSVSL